MSYKANIFGDVRAEADSQMLDSAFYETVDYKSLIESSDRAIVVGRRGTGKSALCYKLESYWRKKSGTKVIKLVPDEAQMIGLREIANLFGEKFSHVKAGTRVAWRYAIYMEVLLLLRDQYKFKREIEASFANQHLIPWGSGKQGIATKLRIKLKNCINREDSPATRVAELVDQLQVHEVERFLKNLLDGFSGEIVLLVDKLDEGYEPDEIGVALVDGFVQAAIDINTRFTSIRAVVFLRDNIFRAIAEKDPDYTRNIEGQVIRLHWDAETLFELVCKRLTAAFKVKEENNRKLWNRFTANELQNFEGFVYCLRHTLYRPRDALILMNNAFYEARQHNRDRIIKNDIDFTAQSISQDRLIDLHKEYDSVFPSLSIFTSSFSGCTTSFSVEAASKQINILLREDTNPQAQQQDMNVFSGPLEVIRELYSVGFLGIKDEKAGKIIFCHDGRTPDKELSNRTELLIHPCYWIALNLKTEMEGEVEPDQIFDEYEIEVKKVNGGTDSREKRIGQLMNELDQIELGQGGASEFEAWVLEAIKIAFAGGLRNVALHPNKNALLRRDVVATNQSETKTWQRIYEDYNARQVVFEVKNFEDLELDNYRQVASYLKGEYGRIGFIVTRKKDLVLTKKEQSYLQEFYADEKKLIVKLSAHQLRKCLSKQRNPQKFDVADKELSILLDKYSREYLAKKHL